MHSNQTRTFRTAVLLAGLACGILAACGESTMRLESDMNVGGDMTLAGDLNGSMRIDGPIEINMQMQGPSVTYTGVFVSESLLERVHIDSTTSDWLLAVFGEPTSRAALDDGTEIWKWAYLPLSQQGSFVTILSTGGGGKEEPTIQTATTFIQLRDGVVIDKWRD